MTDSTSKIPTHFNSQRLLLRSYQSGDGPLLFAVAQKNRQHLQQYESENALLEPKNEVEAEALACSLAANMFSWLKLLTCFQSALHLSSYP